MLNQTDVFVSKDSGYLSDIFTKVQKVYKIDDCDITVSHSKADVKSSLTSITKKISNKGFLKIIENYRKVVKCNVPVKTYEEYLKELKDCILQSEESEINLVDLDRIFIPVNHNTVVGNVVVVGKEETNGAPVLINELFIDGAYVKTVEYLVEDLLNEYNNLQSGINVYR